MGYIETGYKSSVDVLTWNVLPSLITYERTRESQRMSTQRAYKTLIKYTPFPMRSNCVLKSDTWKMFSSLDRIIKPVEVTSRSCFIYLTAKGAKKTLFFFFFLTNEDLSLKGSLYLFSTPLYVDKLLKELCTADISRSRIARIRKLSRGGDVGKGVCLTYTDRYRNYDYMKAGISTNERPNEWKWMNEWNWMNERMNEWMNSWMNDWMNKLMNERMDEELIHTNMFRNQCYFNKIHIQIRQTISIHFF